MSTPQVLQSISARLYTREKAKATVQWNEMLDEIRVGLRLTFKELVDALVDRHHPQSQMCGTRKKLVGVERLLEFLNTFSKQNVANDEELKALVAQVRGLLAGQDISRLRKDQDLRELVKERMESAKVILDPLVEDAPSRQIVLRIEKRLCFAELRAQPGLGVVPGTISTGPRQPHQLGRLLHGEPRIEPELHELRRFGVHFRQCIEGLVDGQQVIGRIRWRRDVVVKGRSLLLAAALFALLLAGIVDQDAAHRLGGGGIEVNAIVEARRFGCSYQPQVGFMDQRRRVQRLSRLFLVQFASGQLPQLVINQRQKL